MANGTSSTRGTSRATAPPVNKLPPIGQFSDDVWNWDSDDAIEWIIDNVDIESKDEAKALYDAVNTFTAGSGAIRIVQQGGSGSDSVKEKAKNVEKYIESAPQWDNSQTLYRGLKLSPADIAKIQVGQDFDVNYGGSASWSTKVGVAQDFACPYSGKSGVVAYCKKMRKATPIKHISNYMNENEVLSSKDNKFRTVSIKKGVYNEKPMLFVEVEQIE